jgi:hypothetical protein
MGQVSVLGELLPAPVLSVGFTGHRNITTGGATCESVERGIRAVLMELRRALPLTIDQERSYFSSVPPVVRLITMGAEGADLLGIRAAIALGLDLSYVVPFGINDYQDEFSSSSAAEAAANFSQASSIFQLPGKRDEGERAYERANEIIVSNSDVVIAVWDGEQANGRAEPAEAVRTAIAKRVPIIVIDPRSPYTPEILSASSFADFDPAAATDLARKPLPADLIQFIHTIVKPPSRLARRQGLNDLLLEKPGSAAWRSEYPFLLFLMHLPYDMGGCFAQVP